MKKPNIKILILAIFHVIFFFASLWYLRPAPEGNEKIVYGVPIYRVLSSPKSVDHAVVVNGLMLGCSTSSIGQIAYSCPNTFYKNVSGKITYFAMETLESKLGIVDPYPVLLEIEQSGDKTYSINYAELRRGYFLGGNITLICIFGLLFVSIRAILVKIK